MRRRLWVGALGLVLLVPAARYWTWILLSDPVRPADARLAFRRFATAPLGEAERAGGVDIRVSIPDDPSWRRVVRDWGDPGYIVAAVSSGPGQYIYCLKDLDVRVQAKAGDKPVSLEPVQYAPYGYSADCRPAGLRFRAAPGTVVDIRIVVTGSSHSTADLVVEPYWTVGAKDHLVGISIEEDLHLRAIANMLGAAGIIMILFAALPLTRRWRGSRGGPR
jgi:hypothetical protein